MMGRAVVFAGLSPHPPIIIPDIGRERLGEVAETIAGLRRVMAQLVAAGPETVVLVSPHAPRDPRSISAYTGPRLRGDFAAFLAPHIEVDVANDVALLSRIVALCRDNGIATWMLPAERRLDHGALVPLYFLLEAGWHSPLTILGLPSNLNLDHLLVGECIAKAAQQLNRRVALIASGDMSHRLTPDAPYEYHPRAHLYDEALVAAISRGDVKGVLSIDPALREVAGEDTYQSLLIALGATGRQFRNPVVCSYEGPFGVGYLTAVLADGPEGEESTESPDHAEKDAEGYDRTAEDVVALARKSIETFLKEHTLMTPPETVSGKLAQRSGLFVSIKKRTGELRGCIGTVAPTQTNLAEEIIHNAVSAATQDARFDPVRVEELEDLVISVDILSPLEPVSGVTDLDPKRYGVIVESEGGQRGLLLPDLAGIDTVEQQVSLAMKKANIPGGTPVKYYRFTVERIRENPESLHQGGS